MMKLKNRFIGLNKIKEGKLIERKTFLGNNVYEIIFFDDVREEYPEDMLDRIVTPKSRDLTELQELTVAPVAEKIMAILADSEISTTDINHITGFVLPNTLQMAINNAYRKMWGKELSEFTYKDVVDKLKEKDGEKE